MARYHVVRELNMAQLQLPDMPADDALLANRVFEFVQFLLDDDLNLTPAGNLNGAARSKLRTRIDELLSAETTVDVSPEAA